ncbi:hypothetical protein [Paenibacillus xylaniclasticus]|uniref:hypothetical protein n=1 Tax=Paenibacillus xylaniclasticus TaxID=588083 RepID=UPI000FD94E76|nr:hypothetical protein [Paenibacillus xylaniclasticus]GFN32454.1 hypothetical protein PCURB6_27140 [Paenibacillus curdlanolyticus]
MKVTNRVLEQYTQLCGFSSRKCESYHDIEYKIRRHIELGKIIELKDGGDTVIVRYFDLNFTITKNKVVDAQRDKNKPMVWVSEKAKYQYDIIHSKMVV